MNKAEVITFCCDEATGRHIHMSLYLRTLILIVRASSSLDVLYIFSMQRWKGKNQIEYNQSKDSLKDMLRMSMALRHTTYVFNQRLKHPKHQQKECCYQYIYWFCVCVISAAIQNSQMINRERVHI